MVLTSDNYLRFARRLYCAVLTVAAVVLSPGKFMSARRHIFNTRASGCCSHRKSTRHAQSVSHALAHSRNLAPPLCLALNRAESASLNRKWPSASEPRWPDREIAHCARSVYNVARNPGEPESEFELNPPRAANSQPTSFVSFAFGPLHGTGACLLSFCKHANKRVRLATTQAGISSRFICCSRTDASACSRRSRLLAGHVYHRFSLFAECQRNTMYAESGGPCGETPPALASSIQDLLLYSKRAGADQRPLNLIEVFPGVDDGRLDRGPGNASFHRLRAQGAVLVSASRVNGRTRFVRLEALAAQTPFARVKTDLAPPLELMPPLPFEIEPDGVLRVALAKGQVVVVTSKSQPARDWTIRAEAGVTSEFNYW